MLPHVINVMILAPFLLLTSLLALPTQLLYLFNLTLSSLALYSFGDINFSNYKFNGTYRVGYTTVRTHTFDNEVAVYYPID